MALEIAAAEVTSFLHVSDERLDGSPTWLPLDDAEDATLLAGDEDAARMRCIVTAISLVDVDPLHLSSDEALGNLDCRSQSVSVVGIARK